jgi:SAM-dependent methyltransferase
MSFPTNSKESYWNRQWFEADPLTNHPLSAELLQLVHDFQLDQGETLEIGCGLGGLSRLFTAYTGTDLAEACRSAIRDQGHFVCCSAERLLLPDDAFDFVFSIYTLEHVPNVNAALSEIRRVARPGAIVWLKPAWFCRPWQGQVWYHKAKSECTFVERLLKYCVPVRNSLPYRFFDLLQWRLRGQLRRLATRGSVAVDFRCRRLEANFDLPNVVDADAECWLDPLDMIHWFVDRGDKCISHGRFWQRWTKTSAAIMVRIVK